MNKVPLILLMVFLNFDLKANEKECRLEENKNLSVTFINGVGNNEKQAKISRDRIRFTLTPNNTSFVGIPKSKICYQVAHNHSEHTLIDAIETIAQKLQERHGQDFKWTMVSKFLINRGKFLIDTKNNYPELENLIMQDLNEVLVSYAIEKQEAITLNAISEKIKETLEKMPTLVISHSQGNLFTNSMYEKLYLENSSLQQRLESKFANLQIASPAEKISAKIKDSYTAFQDVIIVGGIRNSAGFPIIDPTYGVLDFYNKTDYAIHGLVETYLNPLVYTSNLENWHEPRKEYVISNNQSIWTGSYIGANEEKVDLSYVENNYRGPSSSRIFTTMQDVFKEKATKLTEKITFDIDRLSANVLTTTLGPEYNNYKLGINFSDGSNPVTEFNLDQISFVQIKISPYGLHEGYLDDNGNFVSEERYVVSESATISIDPELMGGSKESPVIIRDELNLDPEKLFISGEFIIEEIKPAPFSIDVAKGTKTIFNPIIEKAGSWVHVSFDLLQDKGQLLKSRLDLDIVVGFKNGITVEGSHRYDTAIRSGNIVVDLNTEDGLYGDKHRCTDRETLEFSRTRGSGQAQFYATSTIRCLSYYANTGNYDSTFENVQHGDYIVCKTNPKPANKNDWLYLVPKDLGCE